MPSRRFLKPLLSAVILAIVAVLGAGAASAHSGHAHGVTNGAVMAIPMAPVSAEPVSVAPTAAMTSDTGLEIETATAMSFDVAVHGAPVRDPPGAGCVGMCCDTTHCGGCVKIAFGKASLPAPLLRSWLPASVESRKLIGRLAEGPNEPPRTFI
jgi:hypothetical protein